MDGDGGSAIGYFVLLVLGIVFSFLRKKKNAPKKESLKTIMNSELLSEEQKKFVEKNDSPYKRPYSQGAFSTPPRPLLKKPISRGNKKVHSIDRKKDLSSPISSRHIPSLESYHLHGDLEAHHLTIDITDEPHLKEGTLKHIEQKERKTYVDELFEKNSLKDAILLKEIITPFSERESSF